jgi:sortase B
MMKKQVTGWGVAAKVAGIGDRILNVLIGLSLVIALLYGGFGLWDTWNIYRKAGVGEAILQYKPTSLSPDEPNPSLEELQKINTDICGWLTVDNTKIDYPVVQGETNRDYLNLSVDGSFSLSGSIFLDSRSARDFSDFYSVIYGHHMEGGKMFGDLPEFKNADYFEAHTTGTLALPDGTLFIEWFACVETDAYDTYLFRPNEYPDTASQEALLEYIRQKATLYRDIDVSTSDRLIALSTCATATTDGRVLLIGRVS